MKKLLIAASAAALSLAAPALANAQEVYGTIGYANVDIDPVNLGAIQGRLGVNFNSHFGIEGEAAFGVADDEILGATVELSSTYGAFLVARMPVSENVDIFVRGGFASGDVDVAGTSASDDGGAYGAGLQAMFTDNDGVRFDYTRYDFGGDADVWSVAYVRKF
ncbi:MAG: porin family protein [Caulobacterales bacterium]|nr:porin family protein [Caulobacterales bacterium]